MILDEIVAAKRLQLVHDKKFMPVEKLSIDHMDIRDFKAALSKPGISIIAEIKKASPSKGIIKDDFDAVKIGEVYEKINIDAVSILTEKQYFKGDNSYIESVKRINTKPILRKDFIVDEYQLYEAKHIKADAVLLIAAILKDRLKEFYNIATKLEINCLVEVHNEEEVEAVLSAGCDIIGINNRDLRDFTVDIKTTERLMKHIPKDKIIVAESGIKTAQDIRYLESIGADAVLIGETFMRQIEDINGISKFVNSVKSRG